MVTNAASSIFLAAEMFKTYCRSLAQSAERIKTLLLPVGCCDPPLPLHYPECGDSALCGDWRFRGFQIAAADNDHNVAIIGYSRGHRKVAFIVVKCIENLHSCEMSIIVHAW